MAAMREVIAAPRAGLDLRAHYGHHQSPAIRAGGLIFCSGMLPVDPDTGGGGRALTSGASSSVTQAAAGRRDHRSSCRCMR
jgi:enamine deaminase RidA (YjgF/YER057c/UK114 family)